jgi:hypothetical protein
MSEAGDVLDFLRAGFTRLDLVDGLAAPGS